VQNPRVRRSTTVAFALTVTLIGLSVQLQPSPASAESKELSIKAAFVYQFATLTKWPDSAFQGGDAPFRIGVMDDPDFAVALSSAVSNKQLEGHPIEVELLTGTPSPGCCHVVYLPNEEAGKLPEILQLSSAGPVLTVSDAKAFVEQGGMIQLNRQGNRLHFSINRGSALQSNLTISSRLLRLATEVIERDGS